MRTAVRAAALCGTVLLGACQSWAPQPATSTPAATGIWQQRQAQLEDIRTFSLQGRAADGRGVKADIYWQQRADQSFDLRLAGPFGVGAVAISGTPQQVVIRTRDGSFETADPEAWMRERIGWAFPVGGLRYWVLGLPIPNNAGQLTLDAQGRLAVLTQAGWTLNYSEYQTQAGLDLPRRFEAQQQDLRLRLVIDRWEEPSEIGSTP